MLATLYNREIDVYINDEFQKTIKRHIHRNDQFYPMRGTAEVQKREWVKIHAVSRGPEYPRWRLDVEKNPWLNPEVTIKK